MTIADLREKCKGYLARVPRDAIILGVLVLASSASFALGYLAGQGGGQGSRLLLEDLTVAPLPAAAAAAAGTGVVASKNGTKYYLPTCAGAERISDANKVWFATPAAATEAGYTPAANCKGL